MVAELEIVMEVYQVPLAIGLNLRVHGVVRPPPPQQPLDAALLVRGVWGRAYVLPIFHGCMISTLCVSGLPSPRQEPITVPACAKNDGRASVESAVTTISGSIGHACGVAVKVFGRPAVRCRLRTARRR
jgi:hypothetical protein